MQRRQDRDAFKEQGLNGTHACVGMKMALDRIAMEEVGQRQETHALMMRQVGLNDHPTLALTTRLTSEVHRFVIAVIVQQPQASQLFQILHGLSRRNV